MAVQAFIELFPFGSVPLRTYLPDGDIDLTALSHQSTEEDLAKDICTILKSEERKDDGFYIKDVRYVPAQVKIVKCIVDNIAVDVSFNQMAGLCTMCFFEEVDRFIGKDHLFKESILLVKSWCYYESRILGSCHCLLSTYALATMVLYIINRFHSSLQGPLSVLYRFLVYYSTFDWDNYSLSVNGPVPTSSLVENSEKIPENDGEELFLNKEFMMKSREAFADPNKAVDPKRDTFQVKILNIVDPLKDNNNLGRSVNLVNLQRIKVALSYGANKLGEILVLPEQKMGEELKKFFAGTLDRSQTGQRPFGLLELDGDEDCFGNLQYCKLYHSFSVSARTQPSPPVLLQIQDTMSPLMQFRQSILIQGGASSFVPRMSRQLFWHPNASQERRISRGTGTYIPDMTSQGIQTHFSQNGSAKLAGRGVCIPDKRYPPQGRRRNPESFKPPPKSDRVEVPSESNQDTTSNSIDFSVDEFPLLPSIKTSVSLETPKDGQATVKYPEVKASSSLLETVSETLEAARKKPETSALTVDLPVHPYQLENDKDFPSLGLERKVVRKGTEKKQNKVK